MTRCLVLCMCLGTPLTGCQKSESPPSSSPASESPSAGTPKEETPYKGKTPSQWIKDLEDPDPTTRRQAAITLTAIAGLDAPNLGLHGLTAGQKKAAVPKLIAMLKEADASNRAYAAQALTLIGRPEAEAAIPVLKELRDDPDEFARGLIREALDELQGSKQDKKQSDKGP